MVPICLIGRGYDFKDAQGHLSDLEARLDPAKLFELRQALGGLASDARDPKSVQAALFATLPRIIAVNWEPESGKHQLDARAVVNVLWRVKTQALAKPPHSLNQEDRAQGGSRSAPGRRTTETEKLLSPPFSHPTLEVCPVHAHG